MNILSPYVGEFYSAKSASEEIDLDAIFAACDEIDSKANDLSSYSENVSNFGNRLTADVFSVDGATMISSVNDCCENIINSRNGIIDFTAQIREAAVSRYNELQQKHNEYAISENERRARNG